MQTLFQTLPQSIQQNLLKLPVDSQCPVFKRQIISQQSIDIEEPTYAQIHLLLQIRGNYVLHLDTEGKQIISGFECDIAITFKMIRTLTTDEQEVGQLLGIQFRSQKFPKKSVFLYIPDNNKMLRITQLEKLSELLGRKYILQDGFHQIYRAIKKIGKGVTASVYRAIRLTDRKEVAVKSFKKQIYYKMDDGRGKVAFQKQFKAMTEIDCKFVCKLIGVYESQNSIYIVLQLLTRSLYSYLRIHGVPPLKLSKQIMAKLLIGLGEIHKKNLMHRDLKLENIMIIENGSSVQPVIIDLGLIENQTNSEFVYTKCGTPGYVAPQVLNLKSNQLPSPPYSKKCDIFSLGVIFYILLVGKTLFEGSDERQVVRKNRECEIDYDFSAQNQITFETKDLLRKMLQKDPSERMSVQELLGHEFFKQLQSLKQLKTRNTSTVMQLIEQREKQDEQSF